MNNYFIHRVQKYDISSKHLLTFGTYGTDSGQLNDPLGITVHNGKVYIAETRGHHISVFYCDDKFSHIIVLAQLSSPWYVTVSNDQLLVADWGLSMHLRV